MRLLLFALLLLLPCLPVSAGSWIRDGAAAPRATLDAELAAAEFVLLGETHDNPHHHAAQAALLRAMVAAGRRPAVVWEMVRRDRQDAVDAWAAGPRATDPGAFAQAVDWAGSGWPDFALYRPIVAAAAEAGLSMIAGGLEGSATRLVAGGGLAALSADRIESWGLAQPLPDAAVAAHLEAVFDGHCRLVPRDRLGPMVDVQAARDASMAAAMLGHPDGAVLIAGRGHVREDIGVPLFLRRLAPGATVLTVGKTEGGTGGPFDWTRAFPAPDRADPCDGLRRHLGR